MNDLEPYKNETQLVRDVLSLAREQQSLIEKLIADLDEAQLNEKNRNPVIVCPHCGKRVN